MKVAFADDTTVATQGVQRTKTFQIKTSAHAFKILSSGLYSDKIAAVLREIGCNAHDAHLAIGQKKPFLVKLPTRLDNQFYIKDWGIGMTGDEVETIYTTYFESTKQTSNDFTGAFGLGSKSPFSYADSFTVTAAKDGKKRVYTAYINEQGAPTVSLMHEGPSDEDWPNGVMVGFPVRPDDFDKFKERASRIFRFFDPFPDIIGGTAPVAPTFTEDHGSYAFLSEQTATEMSGHHGYYGQKFNYLKMGNVVYPLKLDNMTFAQGKADPFSEAVKNLSNIMVRVNIGDVQVAANREEIQYDDATKKAILDIVSVIPKKTVASLIAEYLKITDFPSMIAFRRKLHDLQSGFQITSAMLQTCGIKKEEADDLSTACVHPTVFKFPKWDEDTEKAQIMHLRRSDKPEFQIRIRRAESNHGHSTFYPDEKTILLIGDSKNPYGRARQAIKEDKIDNCILVMKKKDGTLTDVQRAVQAIKPVVLNMEEQASSIYDVTKKARRKNPRVGEFVEVDGKKIQLDDLPANQKVYVRSPRRSGYKAWYSAYNLSNNKFLDRYKVRSLWSNIEELEPILGKVVAPHTFTEKQIKKYKLDTLPEWSDFTTLMKEKLEDKKTVKAIQDLISKDKFIVDLRYGYPAQDLVVNMVYLAHRDNAAFKAIRSILQTYGLLKVVEEIFEDSTKALSTHKSSDVESTLTRFKELCDIFGATPTIPQSKKTSVLTAASKFKHANLNYDLWAALAKADHALLQTVLETQLKKG